ncbi:MAG TPA: L-histidine N(alpha)-methyltransferase [Vicinamibacterales bacterium]|nr:L-histidine N(alpha)-methyltransferase [Vicinamibacterales bacterium]
MAAAFDLNLITVDTGESIWTESSRTYRVSELSPMLERAGFLVTGQWQEDDFALTLAEAG